MLGALFARGFKLPDVLAMTLDQALLVTECLGLYEAEKVKAFTGAPREQDSFGTGSPAPSKPRRWSGPTTNPATGATQFRFDEDHIDDLMNAGFRIKVKRS